MSDAKVKPHLSPTQLSLMSRCGEAYRRRYIEGERIPPGIAMLSGTGVHKGAEVNFRQKIATHSDLPADDIVDAAVSGFDDAMKSGCQIGADDPSPDQARDAVAEMSRLYADEVAPEYQPLFVEQHVRIELPGTHDMVGVLDLADDQGRVVDLKTSNKAKSQDEADRSSQLTFYSAAHRQLTGEIAETVRLEVITSGKNPRRVMLESTRGPADYAALANRINAATATVAAGVFLPADPDSWMCSPKWCGYYATCQYVRRRETTLVDLKSPESPIVRPSVKLAAFKNPVQRLLAMSTRCHWCGATVTARSAVLGHLVPLKDGGSNAPENQCLCCRQCATRPATTPVS